MMPTSRNIYRTVFSSPGADLAPDRGMHRISTIPSSSLDHSMQLRSNINSADDLTLHTAVNIAEAVHPCVVLVTPKGVRNMTARGTGFVLDSSQVADQILAVYGPPKASQQIRNETTVSARQALQQHLYLITAAHVAAPGYAIEITLAPQLDDAPNSISKSYPATVVARNSTLDLALLHVVVDPGSTPPKRKPKNSRTNGNIGQASHETEKLESIDISSIEQQRDGLVLARTAPPVGTLAFAHGHPASRLRGPAMTRGIVCGIADGLGVPDGLGSRDPQRRKDSTNTTTDEQNAASADDSTIFVVTDAAMSGGMSGGPLVDGTGTVLGVNALIRPDLRALGNYAVSSLEVLEFLDSVASSITTVESSNAAQDGTTNVVVGSGTGKKQFKLWLYNDPMNKRARVSSVLNSVAALDEKSADRVMMQAHTKGRGMVGEYSERSEAELVCQSLRDNDLLVEME